MVRNESAGADTVAAFGADLYQVLAGDAADMVFSPSSVAEVLRMAWYGARGQTAAELARVLHLERAGDPGETARPEGQGAAVFRAPNTAWVQSGFPVRPEFTARLGRLAGAMLASADFTAAPEQARAEINQAIAGQTEGKITRLLPPDSVTELTRLVLASAVYMKAAWADPFPEDETDDAPFYPEGPDRPGVTVPLMHGRLRGTTCAATATRPCCSPTATSAWPWPCCCRTGRWRRCGRGWQRPGWPAC